MCEKCRDLENFKKISKPSLFFVEAVSYAALPDFSQIYVNYPKKISKPEVLFITIWRRVLWLRITEIIRLPF